MPAQPSAQHGARPARVPLRWFPAGGAVAWWISGSLFLLLLVAVTRGTTGAWDAAVTQAAIAGRTPWLTRLATAVSWLGSTVPLVAWSGATAVWIDRRFGTRWRCLLRLLVVLFVDVMVVAALKHLVDRPRPPVEDHLVDVSTLSFPSGHATASAAAVSMLLLCLLAVGAPRPVLALASVLGLPLVVAMDWSRVYLGVHYLSDVVAGTILGLWLTLSCLWMLDLISGTRGSLPTPAAQAPEDSTAT